jgi:hypothetical protein
MVCQYLINFHYPAADGATAPEFTNASAASHARINRVRLAEKLPQSQVGMMLMDKHWLGPAAVVLLTIVHLCSSLRK